MKRVAFLVLLSVAFLSLISCEKNSEHVISGRLMKNCEQPEANTEVHFYQNTLIQLGKGSHLGTAITDEDGNFSFTYKTRRGGKIRMEETQEIMSNIPDDQSVDLGHIYLSEFTAKFEIKIQTSKAYTESDSLLLATSTNGTSFNTYFGPYSSGTIDLIGISLPFKKLIYSKNYDFQYSYKFQDTTLRKTNYISTKPCSGEMTPVVIVLP